MDSFNNRRLIVIGLSLIILSGGLFTLLNLTQNRQTIKSKASSNLVSIEIISPREGTKVLGLTQIRAVADSNLAPENSTSVLQIDGSGGEPLDISGVDGKIIMSGKWDSSKYSQGVHTLAVFLYDKQSSPPTLLGNSRVSVTVIPP